MSARAIAAVKQRDARPLSAYEEVPMHRIAAMSPSEVRRRDRLISGSCSAIDRAGFQDAIHVQMEDITSGHCESNREAAADTSTETIAEVNCTGVARDLEDDCEQDSDNSRLNRMRSQPIVEWAVPKEYMSSPIVDALSKMVDERPTPPHNLLRVRATGDGDYCHLSYPEHEKQDEHPTLERPVSLLEKIIRTRTIWYLPHLSRPEALHYLRIMEPGNFIVRSSSRENCMAISVKLPPGLESDTGHYIIEKVPVSMVLSHSAQDLQNVAGSVVRLEGSKQTFRSLPYLINYYCLHRDELQTKLTLPSVIANCKTTRALQSIALMEQEFWTSEMSLSRDPRPTARGFAANRHRHGGSSEVSTTFMGSRSRTYDDAINCYDGGEDVCDGVGSCFPIRDVFTDVPNLGSMKSKKRPSSARTKERRFVTMHGDDIFFCEDGESTSSSGHSPPTKHDRLEVESSISRTDRRSQSVRTPKHTTPTKDGSQTLNRSSRPRSFLKSLFSFGSPHTERRKKNEHGSNIQLANCSQFTPWNKSEVKASRSAFEITSVPQRSVFGSPKKHYGNQQTSSGNIFEDEDNYSRPWRGLDDREMIPNGSPGGRSMGSEQMRTFKPAPPARGRSTATSLRREKSDLSEVAHTAAMRLAKHNESSPGPRNQQLQHKASLRSAMRPPQNANDPQVIKSCVEELRRKRLQSTTEMLGEDTTPTSSTLELNERCGEVRPIASPNIMMRRRQQSQRDKLGREHRLSVPNLAAPIHEFVVSGAVGQTARALKERLGRNGDGELMICNEGLVTPVVRRKNFTVVEQDVLNGNRCTDRPEPVRAVLPTIVPPRNKESSTNESELIWRRKKPAFPDSEEKPVIKPSWSAVNVEFKNRQQKVAKVRPTQQFRAAPRATMDSMSTMTSKSSGDYAQLSDLTGIPGDRHSKLEDDNVSVAGTVFNEPWDSNVWENLLDLAHHGDESQMRMNRTIHEEDQDEDDESDDSDMTACGSASADDDVRTLQRRPRGISSASSSRMDDSDEEDLRTATWKSQKRPLPSDKVVVKAWDHEADTISKFSTLDSRRMNESLRNDDPSTYSLKSLPRTLSRFSHGLQHGASIDSLDDMSTNLPSMSPLFKHRFNNNIHANEEAEEDDLEPQDHIGSAIQNYVERLAQVKSGANACFGLTLRQFIACTKETRETDPSVMVRNVRQFINGMKNYLVKNGEGDLHAIIDEESARLSNNQILNIDAVLEVVLHKLLLKEVKQLLYHAMVKEHSRSGALQSLTANIAIVRKMTLAQLGFVNAASLTEPSPETMREVSVHIRKMVKHYSPLKKLENLMKAVTQVLSTQQNQRGRDENVDPTSMPKHVPNADDLVRWMVFILAKTSTVGCEVEAWYMWELLPQSIFSQSDASYYLTALFSAVHILKSQEAITNLSENDNAMMNIDVPSLSCSSPQISSTLSRAGKTTSSDAFVKIAIPDEAIGCIRYSTFPGIPQMSTSKLSRVIAHQQGITNPEEHGLYLISGGYETCLQATDCPVLIREKLKKDNKPHLFAYKRHDAKIAWPRTAISC